jgi:predicted DNA repair protein MutK
MSIGLIALLDDIAAIAKVAAASLDDVVTQAAKAGIKAAGVVEADIESLPPYPLLVRSFGAVACPFKRRGCNEAA